MKSTTKMARRGAGFGTLLIGMAMVSIAGPADAQYFGRNKVQYESFDFRIMRSEHFDVHFYREFGDAATDATRMLERWYGRFSTLLDYTFTRNPVILYANHPDFQQTNVIGGELSQGTGGVTEALRTRVVLPLTGVYRDNDHVLGHELVHVFQYDISQSEKLGGGLGNLTHLPLWVIEGFAEYLSIGRNDAHTSMWMRDAVLRDALPTVTQLSTDPRFFPYRYGQAVWAFIGGRWDDTKAADLYKHSARVGSFETGIRSVLGLSPDTLSLQWHAAVRAHYTPLMEGRTDPDKAGRPVIVEKDEGALNISPAVSPDGKYVAFFSQRGPFSVDLYVADAETGRIVKTLASPTRGGHFDNLSFINSVGAWSPDSRRFAHVVFANGDNEIHILDVASRDVVSKIRTRDVGAVSAVAWSPDGRQLAFSGIANGVGDLFLVNVDGSGLVRLTNDKFAAIHPTWSPDGRYIAFATDQGPGANLDNLAVAPMRIALLDMGTRQIQLVPGFSRGKNINPQFSADGSSIYFVSDVDGFSDIYRVQLATGAISRVTRLKTGVSGITYLSPAISMSQTGRLVFSVFAASGTNIFALEAGETAGEPVASTQLAEAPAGMLPPIVRSFVDGYLNDYTTHLPSQTTFPDRPYSARLGLDYIGETMLGFTSSPYASGFTGSIAAYFGDMLGNRTVGAAIASEGGLKDFGAQAFYMNAATRWNWAVIGGRVPYLSGFASVEPIVVDNNGTPVEALRVQQTLRRTYFDQASVAVQYPFSSTRRFELDVGVTRVSYSTETLSWIQVGRQTTRPQRQDVPSPPAIGFAQVSGALVGDNSFFGYTSPVMGGRYRIETTPTFGGLDFVNLLMDGRKYFFMRPFTFAVRGMHIGRYGSGAEDERLSSLYVGSNQLVRGYDIYSFTANDCRIAINSCPEFDRLIGSRIAVANAELRIPLFGSSSFGVVPTTFIPVEIAFFGDAGLAWSDGESVELRFDRQTGDRVPVVSAGVAARLNLFGLAVAEVFYAIPFQRPGKNNVWGLQLLPGW